MTQEVVQLNLVQNIALLSNLQVAVLIEKNRKAVWENRYGFMLFGSDPCDVIGNTIQCRLTGNAVVEDDLEQGLMWSFATI